MLSWQRLQLFYVLAVFGVLSVLGGLWLTSRITQAFRDSVTSSRSAAERLGEYVRLAEAAAAVNGPANDVFGDLDVPVQARRLERAVGEFDATLAAVRSNLSTTTAGEARSALIAQIDDFDRTARAMATDAAAILEHVRRQEPQRAARRMAAMDDRYAYLNGLLATMRVDALYVQERHLESHERRVVALQQYQIPLAAAILLMVGGSAVYGTRASAAVLADARVRHDHVLQLEKSEQKLEHRVAERTTELRENERRFNETQRLARIGSWEWDLRTNAVTWSDETYRIYGLAPRSIVPSFDAYLEFVHPEDRELVHRTVRHTLETKEPFSYDHRMVRADGALRILAVTGRMTVDDTGAPLRMGGASQDVTDQRAADHAWREAGEQLRESEERFQFAARATNDALWDWVIASNTIWWNQGFSTKFGHTKSGPTLDFWMALIHPDDAERLGHSLHVFLETTEEVWTDEYRFRRHDGTYAWVLDRGIVLRNADGSPRRMIGSMMDITERKQSERTKSDFVSFVSHQLRTPLSGMSWMLELAEEADTLPDAREYVAAARESSTRLAVLVNELLDIARLESGRTADPPSDVPLDQLTRSVLQEFQALADGKRLMIDLHTANAVAVWADSQMLRQVVANLLSNAIKYTQEGGRIDVRIEQRNGTAEWSVQDNGPGVPAAALPRIFEKFFRAENVLWTDAEGTGLGLHLVRLIVEQAGGRVWCESEEGHGARFTFTLPVAPAEGEAI